MQRASEAKAEIDAVIKKWEGCHFERYRNWYTAPLAFCTAMLYLHAVWVMGHVTAYHDLRDTRFPEASYADRPDENTKLLFTDGRAALFCDVGEEGTKVIFRSPVSKSDIHLHRPDEVLLELAKRMVPLARDVMRGVAGILDAWVAVYGKPGASLDTMLDEDDRLLQDLWGQRYDYELVPERDRGWILRSAGPDKTFHTEDDLVMTDLDVDTDEVQPAHPPLPSNEADNE